MDGSQTKKIVIVVVCMVVAVVVTLIMNKPFAGGGGEGSKGSKQLLCVNESCGKAFEMSRKDYQKELGPTALMPGGDSSIKCPGCDEKSAFTAAKCEKCGDVFIPDYSQEVPNACPKCGSQ